MRRVVFVIGLELYAVLLASLRLAGGVLTDEAKYLLNIPYPHPPLARWILSTTQSFQYQELFWRIAFATIVIQAVWLIWDMGKKLNSSQRMTLCCLWLLSAAVVLQAGTVMMAPLTAVQGLLFVWLYYGVVHEGDRGFLRFRGSRGSSDSSDSLASYIGLVWLTSLFTAYQAVLYVPIVIAIYRRMQRSNFHIALYVGLPIALLALYTLGNPFALASFVDAGTKDAGISMVHRFFGADRLWILGGSLVLSALGLIGMIRTRNWPVVFSLLLVYLYVVVSHRNYYAILFTPLLIAGAATPIMLKRSFIVFALMVVATGFFVRSSLFDISPSVARQIVSTIPNDYDGPIYIEGSFGHQWQYESPWPVRRLIDPEGLQQVNEDPSVWIR